MNNGQGTFKKEDFLERVLNFAVRIIKLVDKLPKKAAGFKISSQLVGSATSIGANTQEAQDASSKPDFINKMNIALREAKETKYWLTLIKRSGFLSGNDVDPELAEADELCAIYSTIVKKAKLNLSNLKSQISNVRGFTLIELLVAFSATALLSVMGFAAFVSYQRNQIIGQAVAELRNNLAFAKAKAQIQEVPFACTSLLAGGLRGYKVTFTAANYEIKAVCSDNSEVSIPCREQSECTIQFPSGVRKIQGPDWFLFPVLRGSVQANTPSNTSGQWDIVLDHNGRQRAIAVTTAGGLSSFAPTPIPTATPIPLPTPTATPASPTATPIITPTPTPTATPTPTPTSAPTTTPTSAPIGPSFISMSFANITSGATRTINKPPGVVAGDLMIAHINCIWDTNASFVVTNPPSGWAQITGGGQSYVGWRSRSDLYRKIAGSAEGSNYTWSFSHSCLGPSSIIVYRGYGGNEMNISNISVNISDHSAPSINTIPIGDNAKYINFYVVHVPISTSPFVTLTIPTGTTQRYQQTFTRFAFQIVDAVKSPPGPTGEKISVSSQPAYGVMFTLGIR